MANKKYEEQDGVWRTIGGRRVFIKTGQSLPDAMKESGKFKTRMDEKAVKGAKKEDLKEQYMQSLNDVSKMEYNGEITRDEYDEAIKNINKTYKDRMLKQESPVEEEVRLEKEAKESWEKEEKVNKSLSKQYNEKEKENDRLSKGMTKEEYKEGKYSFEKEKTEYELYKRAKENPDSIDPMTENSTDWEALDRKYRDKYNSLSKVKNNRVVENVNTGSKYYEVGNGQWRSEKDGYDYYIDFNSSNKDNQKYRDVATGKIINTNPRADNYWDYENTGVKKQDKYDGSLPQKYKGTIDYLQQNTNMTIPEIYELLKKIEQDKK